MPPVPPAADSASGTGYAAARVLLAAGGVPFVPEQPESDKPAKAQTPVEPEQPAEPGTSPKPGKDR